MPPTFTVDWFSHCIPQWETLLGALRGKPDLRFLEIGSWEGRSACWLLENVLTHPTSSLTCVDTFAGNRSQQERSPAGIGGVEERFDQNIRESGAQARVRKIKAASEDALAALPRESFSFIFIDGSHDARDVLTDAVLSWRLLAERGIAVFDDYEWDRYGHPLLRPKAGVDAFLAVFGPEAEILSTGWQVAVRKLARPAFADERLRTVSAVPGGSTA